MKIIENTSFVETTTGDTTTTTPSNVVQTVIRDLGFVNPSVKIFEIDFSRCCNICRCNNRCGNFYQNYLLTPNYQRFNNFNCCCNNFRR